MNIDYRLDLFNALKNYQENMTDDDSILLVCHNFSQGDLLLGVDGNIDNISAVLTNEHGEVNLKTKAEKKKFAYVRSSILNVAINILRADSELRKKFSLAMMNLIQNDLNANSTK